MVTLDFDEDSSVYSNDDKPIDFDYSTPENRELLMERRIILPVWKCELCIENNLHQTFFDWSDHRHKMCKMWG